MKKLLFVVLMIVVSLSSCNEGNNNKMLNEEIIGMQTLLINDLAVSNYKLANVMSDEALEECGGTKSISCDYIRESFEDVFYYAIMLGFHNDANNYSIAPAIKAATRFFLGRDKARNNGFYYDYYYSLRERGYKLSYAYEEYKKWYKGEK